MATRAILVPDTNVLLHAVSLDQISWGEVAGVDEVELVLVPQVLHELDTKKYGNSEKLKKRAQRITAKLDKWLPSGTQSATISSGVTLRVQPREPVLGPGFDPAVADDRIIASVVELAADATAPVMVVSWDITMRFKAEARGIRVVKVPERFRIAEEDRERKEPTKTPRVVAGFWDEDDEGVVSSVAVPIGMSAAHLLPEARRMLAASRSQVDYLTAVTGIVGEPGEGDYRRYIEAIQRFDEENAKVFEFALAVANAGTAPADDVVVEFWLPATVVYHERKPRLPEAPRRRDYLGLRIPQFPTHVERNESFTFSQHDDGTVHAEIRVKRLMQSKRVGYSVWGEFEDDAIRGFPIQARVLVGSPAVTVETQLNLRIQRDAKP